MTKADFWSVIDKALEVSSTYRLTAQEREHIAKEEQACYENNIDAITRILKKYDTELQRRGFWTECQIRQDGLRFRYSLGGYYGPGGFSSQFHTAGPLVLGEIVPHGDAFQSFYKNDIDLNVQIGADFESGDFEKFIQRNIEAYVSVNNLIVTKEQYDRLRHAYPNK